MTTQEKNTLGNTSTGMPEEWEEYTIRVKKDPSWPYHGTDIEFNGMTYVRADLTAASVQAGDVLKAAIKQAEDYYNGHRSHIDMLAIREIIRALKLLTKEKT